MSSVLDKITEFLVGEADYDQRALLREARDELAKSRTTDPLRALAERWRAESCKTFGEPRWSVEFTMARCADELEAALSQAGEGVAPINPPEIDSKLIVPGRKLVFPSPGEHQESVAWQRQYAEGWNACRDAMLAAAPAAQGASGPTANVGELAVQIANELARVDGYDPEDVHGGLYDLRWMGGPVPEPAGDTWNMDYLPKGERIARTLVVAAAPPVVVDEATRLFNAGWYACAKLADRDDLPHDVGSPFHAKALAAALKQGVG